MDVKLYPHQEKFLKENPHKALCAFEAGTGKTLTAVKWLQTRQYNALVIVPKRILLKWKNELKENNVKATVVTKEQFKKLEFENPSALILDEAHFASASLFTKGRSQIATKVYNFVMRNPDMPVLLLTATPISSSPANLHTLLCYMGKYIEWKKWRSYFYNLEKRPYLPYPAWIPKKNWRKLIQPILLKHAHIALLRDLVDMPKIEEIVLKTPYKPLQSNPEWTPMASFVAEHRNEQLEKPKVIREIGEQYRKVVVVAHFREQIDQLYKELSKDKQTYVLHGGTKDQEEVIKQAQEDDECYLICQYGIGAGWEIPSFSVMIFASMGYSVTNFLQMTGRIVRINDLHPVKYFFLQSGRCDKAIYTQIKKGFDFIPSKFI